MSWLTVLAGLISLISRMATYLGDKQLISAGSSAAIAQGLRDTLQNLDLARRVSDAIVDPRTAVERDYAERVRNRFKRPDE
jgi:hypothetical protein